MWAQAVPESEDGEVDNRVGGALEDAASGWVHQRLRTWWTSKMKQLLKHNVTGTEP
ncbi:hypothetical protein TRIUR3_04834 [Triticum urartu]|uniref:Uncharacterized protein n=1 Tax=Triticum urartu TaxID=4572 RepID=M7Z711_TRIUA|nr:hypothetical protein TRIUR3_04834 [Triticum urartu]